MANWTNSEVMALYRWSEEGASNPDIAVWLNRTVLSVAAKRRMLSLCESHIVADLEEEPKQPMNLAVSCDLHLHDLKMLSGADSYPNYSIEPDGGLPMKMRAEPSSSLIGSSALLCIG